MCSQPLRLHNDYELKQHLKPPSPWTVWITICCVGPPLDFLPSTRACPFFLHHNFLSAFNHSTIPNRLLNPHHRPKSLRTIRTNLHQSNNQSINQKNSNCANLSSTCLRKYLQRPQRKPARSPRLALMARNAARSARKPTAPTSTRCWSRSTLTPGSAPRPCLSWTRSWTTSSSASVLRLPAWPNTTSEAPSRPARSKPRSVCFSPVNWPSTRFPREPKLWPSTPAPNKLLGAKSTLVAIIQTALFRATNFTLQNSCVFTWAPYLGPSPNSARKFFLKKIFVSPLVFQCYMTELRLKTYLGLKISVGASYCENPARFVRFCAVLWTVDQFCAEIFFFNFFVSPLVFQRYMTELRLKTYLGLKISVWASYCENPARLVRFCAVLWTVDQFCAVPWTVDKFCAKIFFITISWKLSVFTVVSFWNGRNMTKN